MSVMIPENYKSNLSSIENEQIIFKIKETFSNYLRNFLYHINSPLFVQTGSGINDDLDGSQDPVHFSIDYINNSCAEIVHSLAKWKRIKVTELNLNYNQGIYTDMNAIRKCETLDNIHSLFVDQWDWEIKIKDEDRNLATLKKWAGIMYSCIYETAKTIKEEFNIDVPELPQYLAFIHAEELLQLYPDKTPEEREYLITKEHKAIFICGIGKKLSNGITHDSRADDYDDWITENEDGYYGLNGDILLWNDILQQPLEITSMGIRVNAESLQKQLLYNKTQYKMHSHYQNMVLHNALAQTIGGGIGQSRLCMFILQKAHIGEVQCSIWPREDVKKLKEHNINLLNNIEI